MKLYFLGTGTSQGIPIIGSNHPVCKSLNVKDKRLRSSVWITCENTSIVIDCGPDFRQQMLKSGCTQIDALLYTHEHSDHTAGFDDLRPFCFKQGSVELYGDKLVVASLHKRFDYAFKTENKYPGAPTVNLQTIHNLNAFELNNLKITPIQIWHGNLPILGYRIGNLGYLTDVKTINDSEIEKLKNLDILVINALRIETHPSHLNLEEALVLIDKINPKKTYITHISHLLGFHDVVEQQLPESVYLAYDNLELFL